MDFQKFYQLSEDSRLLQSFRRFHVPIILLMILMVAVVVYVTGGSKYVYSHSMYIPIIYGAAIYGFSGGLLAGLVGGLVLGPFMPLDTGTGEPQDLINWIYRTGFFCIIGVGAGFAFDGLKRQIHRLRQSSLRDMSSGLPNRNALCQNIDLMERNQSTGQFALVLCSIENYSQIANSFGLDASNVLLPQIVSRLQSFQQVQSVCATQKDRIGFLVTGVDSVAAPSLVEDVLDAMVPSFVVDGVPLYCDICTGMAHFTQHGSGTLLQKANLALHHGQENRRRLVNFNPSIQTTPKETLGLLGEIPVALRDNQFQLYYQPKIDIRSRKVFGLEALIRWHHPTRGLIPPYKFIAQAENTGLIQPITWWVIATGLAQLAQWRKDGLDIALALNISARNLSETTLFLSIEEQLERYGIPPDRVELEVTESAVMTDFEQALNRLTELKSLGLRLAIDDFGTGHSSLAYLKRLPVDSLKIDRAFVQGLTKNKSDQEIVKAVIDLARTFNMQSVAEGVEDEETFSLLSGMGCEAAQGYHFCKPIPAADVFASLAKWQAQDVRPSHTSETL